eukprot:gene16618-biopygen23284
MAPSKLLAAAVLCCAARRAACEGLPENAAGSPPLLQDVIGRECRGHRGIPRHSAPPQPIFGMFSAPLRAIPRHPPVTPGTGASPGRAMPSLTCRRRAPVPKAPAQQSLCGSAVGVGGRRTDRSRKLGVLALGNPGGKIANQTPSEKKPV